MNEFIFFLMSLGVCAFAALTVFSRNIFHSAVWLALTLLGVSAFYFYLDAEFLGVIQVLVYIGGIITLFVFAIKLTAQIDDRSIRQVNRQVIPAAAASLIFWVFLLQIVANHPWAKAHPEAQSISLKDIGTSLLSNYVLPFEFLSLILLAVMVGAIVIGKAKR